MFFFLRLTVSNSENRKKVVIDLYLSPTQGNLMTSSDSLLRWLDCFLPIQLCTSVFNSLPIPRKSTRRWFNTIRWMGWQKKNKKSKSFPLKKKRKCVFSRCDQKQTNIITRQPSSSFLSLSLSICLCVKSIIYIIYILYTLYDTHG